VTWHGGLWRGFARRLGVSVLLRAAENIRKNRWQDKSAAVWLGACGWLDTKILAGIGKKRLARFSDYRAFAGVWRLARSTFLMTLTQ
jgi:uncharacterized BrkB/YihY/UPF0761 family membrane protein